MPSSKWRFWGLGACAVLMSILTGCASVTHGTEQSIKIETLSAVGGSPIEGAECQLSNDKGKAIAMSGQSVMVRRSGGNLAVSCTMAGQSLASGQAISRANAGLAGNIVIGGAIGAAIDVGTGAAYTYPTWLQLVFGEERLFDRSGNRSDGPAAGAFVSANVSPVARAVVGGGVQPISPASMTSTVARQAPPAAGESMGLRASLRRGDILEYDLLDKMTGIHTPVLYRLDRTEGDQLVFDMGGRVERLDGRVISIRTPAGGLFDSSSPPDGWASANLRPGMSWSTEYPRHSLKATVLGESSAKVDGEILRVLQVDYSGWVTVSQSPTARPTHPLIATALYSPELKRIVQFDIEIRSAGSLSRESMQLKRIIRY